MRLYRIAKNRYDPIMPIPELYCEKKTLEKKGAHQVLTFSTFFCSKIIRQPLSFSISITGAPGHFLLDFSLKF
jgi:hypothetical protein